jgi:YfiH family protein
MLSNKVEFKIFDKTFSDCTHMYNRQRFTNENEINEVNHNQQAVLNALDADKVLILNQVDGNKVIDADLLTSVLPEPEADAVVTSLPGLAITIQTADCVPVLLAGDDGNVIGAAHCGWRGAKNDILFNTTKLMQEKGAKNITAIIGPAIHQVSYEVDDSFYKIIVESEREASKFFVPSHRMGHFMFDLPGFVIFKLNKLGITDIINYCENTYTNPEKYFSYRRDVHLGLTGNKTNILSVIVIKKN